ncbi:hypothetical protein GYMLUDRAFT_1026160 [Collybiopsis luxurians FD-317 M1]|nr:hypothetical protein GYMLUDRAFT_1026160 [Collybiopsis luxurians FD-317 M1]
MVVLKRQVLFYIVGLFSLLALIAHASPLATRAKDVFRTLKLRLPGFWNRSKTGHLKTPKRRIFWLVNYSKTRQNNQHAYANNGRIFSVAEPYKGHASKDLTVKNVAHNSLGEVKAFEMNGRWIVPGMLTDEKLGSKSRW